MSEQRSQLLITSGTIKAALKRLRNLATGAAQQEWENARWQGYEAAQAVFDSCEQLLRAIELAERVLSQPPPKPKRR